MGERTRFWQPDIWPGLSCLHATYTAQHFAPHSHDALVVAVTERGGAAYTSRGRTAIATTSDLLVFNPVEPHAGHMRDSREWRYRAVYLTQPALTQLRDALGLQHLPGFTSNAVRDPALIGMFAGAHREIAGARPDLGRERLIDAFGHLFMTYADSARTLTARTDHVVVSATLATIRQQFQERITVDTLAARAGLSSFQLIRLFKRVTGMPPHAHVLRARLHAAIRAMRDGTPLSDTAAAAGFYDQSALTTHFRRAYGITPGHYVRAMRRA